MMTKTSCFASDVRWWIGCAAASITCLLGRPAIADRYEATIVVRPSATVGRIVEDVGGNDQSAVTASVYGGGLDIGVSYGARNWLDVGVEVGGAGFGEASYDAATVMVSGSARTGRLERTSRAAHLRVGATLRGGVAWVPVLYMGIGVAGQQQTAATLMPSEQGIGDALAPDDMEEGISFDGVVAVRGGLEHRLNRHWTLGAHASVSHSLGIGAPPLDTFSTGISVACTWYPLF